MNFAYKSFDFYKEATFLSEWISMYHAHTSEGDGIDSEEAKRSPLSPDFSLYEREIRKSGDNSDQKNDPNPNGSERKTTSPHLIVFI